jgi:hypothetical protein
MNISLNLKEPQKIILGLGDKSVCGEFWITNYSLSLDSPRFIEILGQKKHIGIPCMQNYNLQLNAVSNGNLQVMGIIEPTIRNKRVEDCTIQELLFAVRQKI